MSLSKKNKILFPMYVAGIPVIFLISLLPTIHYDEIYLDAIIIGFFIAYVVTVIYTIRIFSVANFYLLFTLLSSFFIYNSFFYSLFRDYNFLITGYPIRMQFEKETGFFLICLSFLFVYVMHIFYVWFSKDNIENPSRYSFEGFYNNIYEKIGIFIMILFTIPVATKAYIQLNHVMNYGYLAIFRGDLQELNYPIWTTGSFIIFSSGYYIFLSSFPKSKIKYVMISLLFLSVATLHALTGQRLFVLSALLAILVFYKMIFNAKIQFKSLLRIIFACLLFSVLMGNMRVGFGNGTQNDMLRIGDSLEIIEHFLYEQTNTRMVPMLIIERDIKHHTYPFIFSPIVAPLLRTVSLINGPIYYDRNFEITNDISFLTMYTVSRDFALMGAGYGGAVLAEFYNLGGVFGVILMSMILAFILTKCEYLRISKRYRFIFPVIFMFLLYSVGLARNRFFSFFDIPVIIFSLLVCLVIPLLKYIKNERK